MESYKERLAIEQKELKDKFTKLVDFINSPDFYQLSPNNKQLLRNQKIAMELYLNVLNMRVFEDVDKIVVPDYGVLQMMGNAFAGSSLFSVNQDSEKYFLQKPADGLDKKS